MHELKLSVKTGTNPHQPDESGKRDRLERRSLRHGPVFGEQLPATEREVPSSPHRFIRA